LYTQRETIEPFLFFSSAIPIEFIKSLTGAKVNENDTVNFICELNKPNIHVKWFLDGEPIPHGRFQSWE
jgi:hypothetical protein